MMGRRRGTQSEFVKILRRKRGKKRVPMRELAFEIDRRLYLLARARALFTRALAQGLFLLSRGGGPGPPGVSQRRRLRQGEAGDERAAGPAAPRHRRGTEEPAPRGCGLGAGATSSTA